MQIISEIQRGGKKEGPSICITASLTDIQKREIQMLGQACQSWEPVTQSPMLDSSENVDPTLPCFYIYYENTFPISFLSVFIPDGTYAEVTGFTLPGYRKKGHFAELLVCAKEELKDQNLTFYIVSDGKSQDTQAMLSHKGMDLTYSEMMMATSLEELAQMDVPAPSAELVGYEVDDEAEQEELFSLEQEEDEYVLYQGQEGVAWCKLAFFPGTAYLYGFEVEESLRRHGYGRYFLKQLAQSLLDWQADPESEVKLPPQAGEVHTMLLQVGTRNVAACGLYDSCGFVVTEKLDYYLA